MTNGWQVYRISDLLTQNSNNVKVAPDKSYKLLGISLEGRGAFLREEKTGDSISATSLSPVHAGDFIYSRLFAWRGAFDIVSEELDGCFVSNEFPTFKINTKILLPKFLRLYFNRKIVWEEVEKYCTGTTKASRNRFKEQFFLGMEIPLPPLTEQRRIMAHIESLAARFSEAQRLRDEIEKEAEALFTSAVTNLSFDKKYWTNVDFALSKHKGAIHSGPFGSDLTHDQFVESGVAAIGTRDVQVNKFLLGSGWYVTLERFEGLKQYQIFSGDVLVTIIGGSIGRFCVVPVNVPLAFTTKHVIAMQFNPSIAEPRYMSYMLNFHRRCRETMFSQTAGSAQPSLNITKIKAIEIPVPPLDEQRRIVAYLDGLQVKVNAVRELQSASGEELSALMPSILDKAFKREL